MFTEIMQYTNPNFAPVKPQGNQGDWKNDGHDPLAGRYYQVYSPEQQFEEAAAIAKLKDDFDGLISKWGDTKIYPNGVREFFFVFNDRLRVTPGGYPTTIATLEELRQAHKLSACKLLLTKHLEDMLLNLDEDKIIAVVGFPPNPANIKVLKLELVGEVVRHIVENTPLRRLDLPLVSPDFNEKIKFNGLFVTAALLQVANYCSGALETYFNANSDFTRQEVCARLKGLYNESKGLDLVDQENDTTAADQQLIYILDKITPMPPQHDSRLTKELQDAALVIMAYFFESCDIFEEPK